MSGRVTVNFHAKWLWLVLGIVFVLIALAPVMSAFYPVPTQSPASNPSQFSPGPGPVGNSSSVTNATGTTTTASSSPSGGGGGPAPNCSNPCIIVIQNSQFGTGATVIVKVGTTVTWQNHDDTEHTTTSNTGAWSSPILTPGQSFSFTPKTPGTYPYQCKIHPMTGTLVVVS